MKLEKICRTCLLEKTGLRPLFDACVPSMLMSCTSIHLSEGDGLPRQICTQCLQMVNRAFSFKQQCEKADSTLREYVDQLNLSSHNNSIMNVVKGDQLFNSNDVPVSLFTEIFNDTTNHNTLTNTYSSHTSNVVVPDLAEAIHSLQTITDQYLPDTWTPENVVSCQNSHETACNSFDLENLYKCQFCGDVYKDEWSLGEHIKNHTGQNKYFTNSCSKACPPPLLNKSVLDDNLLSKNLQTTALCPQTMFNCNVCDHTFHDETSLKLHLRDTHFTSFDNFGTSDLEKRFTCSFCHKTFKQNKLLTIHMRVHTGERPFNCEICGRNFTIRSSLIKHRNIHSEKKYSCSFCGRKFSQNSNLTTHMRTHTGEKPFMCNFCGKMFTTSVLRDVHVKIHTGEKPYKCTSCDRLFSTKSQLKKHATIHTGLRPYQCWQCGQLFRHKETRDTHVRYHTGERPYACTLCPKKYFASSHLRVHMKYHNGERKYQCNICMKKFVEHRTLKSHILTHTGERPFPCKFCDSRFTQSATLNNHIKNKHKNFLSI